MDSKILPNQAYIGYAVANEATTTKQGSVLGLWILRAPRARHHASEPRRLFVQRYQLSISGLEVIQIKGLNSKQKKHIGLRFRARNMKPRKQARIFIRFEQITCKPHRAARSSLVCANFFSLGPCSSPLQGSSVQPARQATEDSGPQVPRGF